MHLIGNGIDISSLEKIGFEMIVDEMVDY